MGYHLESRKTLDRPPTMQDMAPVGWRLCHSKSGSGKTFWFHIQTEITQLGMPCPGPPEDLPEGWEKVASSRKGGDPYYYHGATRTSQHERPKASEMLPSGWQVHKSKSTGKTYYYNEGTGESQFERPDT